MEASVGESLGTLSRQTFTTATGGGTLVAVVEPPSRLNFKQTPGADVVPPLSLASLVPMVTRTPRCVSCAFLHALIAGHDQQWKEEGAGAISVFIKHF